MPMEITIKISVNLAGVDTNKLASFLKNIGISNANVEVHLPPTSVTTPFDEPLTHRDQLAAKAKAQIRNGGRFAKKKKSNAGYPSRKKLEALSTEDLFARYEIHAKQSKVTKKYRMLNTLRELLLDRGVDLNKTDRPTEAKKPPLRVVAKTLPVHTTRSR